MGISVCIWHSRQVQRRSRVWRGEESAVHKGLWRRSPDHSTRTCVQNFLSTCLLEKACLSSPSVCNNSQTEAGSKIVLHQATQEVGFLQAQMYSWFHKQNHFPCISVSGRHKKHGVAWASERPISAERCGFLIGRERDIWDITCLESKAGLESEFC